LASRTTLGWRRHENEVAFALRITRRGLKAIQVEDAPDAKATDAAGNEQASVTKRPSAPAVLLAQLPPAPWTTQAQIGAA
jgi:hypothetical protein